MHEIFPISDTLISHLFHSQNIILVMHKISSPEASGAEYKGLYGFITRSSLFTLGLDPDKSSTSPFADSIEAAKGFWGEILCI